jgi:hypothetical protein
LVFSLAGVIYNTDTVSMVDLRRHDNRYMYNHLPLNMLYTLSRPVYGAGRLICQSLSALWLLSVP